MYHKNLQKLVEIYKAVNELWSEIINEAYQFQFQYHHNLRNNPNFQNFVV